MRRATQALHPTGGGRHRRPFSVVAAQDSTLVHSREIPPRRRRHLAHPPPSPRPTTSLLPASTSSPPSPRHSLLNPCPPPSLAHLSRPPPRPHASCNHGCNTGYKVPFRTLLDGSFAVRVIHPRRIPRAEFVSRGTGATDRSEPGSPPRGTRYRPGSSSSDLCNRATPREGRRVAAMRPSARLSLDTCEPNSAIGDATDITQVATVACAARRHRYAGAAERRSLHGSSRMLLSAEVRSSRPHGAQHAGGANARRTPRDADFRSAVTQYGSVRLVVSRCWKLHR